MHPLVILLSAGLTMGAAPTLATDAVGSAALQALELLQRPLPADTRDGWVRELPACEREALAEPRAARTVVCTEWRRFDLQRVSADVDRCHPGLLLSGQYHRVERSAYADGPARTYAGGGDHHFEWSQRWRWRDLDAAGAQVLPWPPLADQPAAAMRWRVRVPCREPHCVQQRMRINRTDGSRHGLNALELLVPEGVAPQALAQALQAWALACQARRR